MSSPVGITDRTPTGVPGPREPRLLGQTVVVIGGSSGIGLSTASLARAEGAEIVVTGRNPDRLRSTARKLDARSFAAFDAADFPSLERFFGQLQLPVDHVMVTVGAPYYAPLAEIDFERAHRSVEEHFWLALQVARQSARKIRPGGTLLFMSGTGSRRPAIGLSVASAFTAAMPALIKNLALEMAPIRVNLIAAGFVDTPLSASLLGEQLGKRREQLRTTLPIRRVVGPDDVAALAMHVMSNTALTGGTYDVDGGQQLVDGGA